MPERLAASENAARYVPSSKYDPHTRKVLVSAFARMPKDEEGLSFNRTGILDLHMPSDDSKLREITGSRLSVGIRGVFAELGVGASIAALSQFGDRFHFEDDPLEEEGAMLANPVHCLLKGLPFKDEVGVPNSEVASDLLSRNVNRKFWAHPSRAQDAAP